MTKFYYRGKYTPIPDDDLDRVADAIYADSQGKIVDRTTFDMHYYDYITGYGKTSKQDATFKEGVFTKMRAKHPKIYDGSRFEEAKGKDFKRDKSRRAKTEVTTIKEYRERGSQNVDLKGYDEPPRYRYARVGNKVERVYETRVNVGGKQYVRYRNKRGQFASVRK